MNVDELFTESQVDVHSTIGGHPEDENAIFGVPVLTDIYRYDGSIMYTEFTKIIRISFNSLKQIKKQLPKIIDIFETCLLPGTFKDIIVYYYKISYRNHRYVVHVKLNPSRIRPERMLMLMAALCPMVDRLAVDVLYYSSARVMVTAPIWNELLIARYMYTMKDYFFSVKDCENLRDVMKIMDFYSDLSDGDAYCAVSDINTRFTHLKNGDFDLAKRKYAG